MDNDLNESTLLNNEESAVEEESTTINISTHDFEEAKGKIKEFAEQLPSRPEFKPFPTSGGLFNWGEHNVTGNELNKFVKTLEQHLIDFNNNQIGFLREFGHVYEAFESLDRDYIQAIIIAVKAAEKASTEAKDAQKDIDVTVDRLCQAIESYKRFKSEIETYKHLKDVDQMWNDLQVIKRSLVKHSKKRKTKHIIDASEFRMNDVEVNEIQNTSIQDLVSQNSKLSRRVNFLTVLSACAVTLVACEAILHLTGVL